MPLSPEIMEMVTSPQASIITSPQVNNNNISTSQSNIPMAVDNSRPPSVVPTEMAMDVDQNSIDISSDFTTGNFFTLTMACTGSLDKADMFLEAIFELFVIIVSA
jgi:hypothetical protein